MTLRKATLAFGLAAALAGATAFPALAQQKRSLLRQPAAAPRHAVSGAPTVEASRASRAPARAAYACPMHAAVKANKPGKCPRCGMALAAARRAGSQTGSAHKCAMGNDPARCPMHRSGKCPMVEKSRAKPPAAHGK